jgi:glycosyltransferase involved in cell wall biosynthesis
MISIIVPAHNESSVIARTLSNWAAHLGADELEVFVICNGCTDSTAEIARRFLPASFVIETAVAGKTHALNLGDQACHGFPRVYIDADIVISVDAIRSLARRLEQGDVLAVAPTPAINLEGCSWAVRKYFEIRSRLPSSREGIGGSGVYALSKEGRERFIHFPGVIADDIYVRLQFKPIERETLPSVKSMVFAPRAISQLAAVRTRAYAGLSQMANSFPELQGNKDGSNGRVLLTLFREPRLWIGLSIYCAINLFARARARIRRRTKDVVWDRDNSARQTPPPSSSH